MKQFTKAQDAQRAELVRRLRRAADDLDLEVSNCNDTIADAYQRVADLVVAYNSILAEANDFLHGVREDAQAYYDDRSEQWQAGEAGEDYALWISELEREFDDADLEDQPSIGPPDVSAADDLEAIPSEVGG